MNLGQDALVPVPPHLNPACDTPIHHRKCRLDPWQPMLPTASFGSKRCSNAPDSPARPSIARFSRAGFRSRWRSAHDAQAGGSQRLPNGCGTPCSTVSMTIHPSDQFALIQTVQHRLLDDPRTDILPGIVGKRLLVPKAVTLPRASWVRLLART